MHPRTRSTGSMVLAALLLPLASPATVPGQEVQTFTLAGDRLAVYDLAGRVEVVPTEQPRATVEARLGGRDAGRLTLTEDEIDGRNALVVRFPDDRIVYPELGPGVRTQVRVRDDGTFDGSGWSLFGGADRVEIRGSGPGIEAWADLRLLLPEGRDLEVHLAAGTVTVENVSGRIAVDVHAGDVRATGIAGRLELDTGSGDVTVAGFEGEELGADTGSGDVDLAAVTAGSLLVDTGSGDVRLARVGATGELRIDTGSGGVRGQEVTAHRLEVDTGSGAVYLDRVTVREGEVDTGSGDVVLGLRSDVEELTVDTGSGDIALRVPDVLGADLTADTGSGDVRIDVPVRSVRSEDDDHLEGVLGDGNGGIELDAGSGDIRVLPVGSG